MLGINQTTIPEIVRKIQEPQLFYATSSYPHSQVISAARTTYSKVIQVISAKSNLHEQTNVLVMASQLSF